MSLEERLVWDGALGPPEITAESFDELLATLHLTDSPREVQTRILTACASKLSLPLQREAFERGLVPPPELPQLP